MFVALAGATGVVLASVILGQAFRGPGFGRYAYFYAYVASTLIGAIGPILIRDPNTSLYSSYYWPVQFVTLVLGYGIILEIFRHVLSPYPGVERFARFLGLATLVAIFCFALVYPLVAPAPSHIGLYGDLEKGVRALQAILLVCILAVISHYGIPLGRNMKGMILGYGLYVGASLVSLAVAGYTGAWLVTVWRFGQPISFEFSLLIWLVALWSRAPNPAPSPDTHLEQDYEAFVVRTKVLIGALRSHLFKAVRS